MRSTGHAASRLAKGCVTLLVAVLAAGCSDTAYLLQSATGHLKLLQAARPVDDWLGDDHTPPALKQRLQLAQSIRRFAVRDLHLPDNASYQRYAQLPRRAVVWNVVAAPTYSLTLKTWCFPVTGCVGYRGYFDEADAQAQATALRAQGWEARVYGVPAYSTLGWTNWLGGDPLLSTFIDYPEGELARMLFHELAHQVLYVQDDTAFNESFATAVERLGSAAWLAAPEHAGARTEYAAFDTRRQAFRALTAQARQALLAVYAPDRQPQPTPEQLAEQKATAYANFRQAYSQLKTRWDGDNRYDAWVANANNAAFGALAAYDDWVDAFESLFHSQGDDWPTFYAAARQLAALPPAERTEHLQQLQRSALTRAPSPTPSGQ
jgi:predicted aminopeptidase